MKEPENIPQEEKLNHVSGEDQTDMLINLESALESRIDHLHLGHEEILSVSDGEKASEEVSQEVSWEISEKAPQEIAQENPPEKAAKKRKIGLPGLKLFRKKKDSSENKTVSEEKPGASWEDPIEEKKVAEEFSDDEVYEPDEEKKEERRPAAPKRKVRRGITPLQRARRRERRIALFWNLVYRGRKQIYWGLVGLIVLIVAMISGIVARNWKYHSYKELVTSVNEDTLSAAYENINGKILKYGVDSAMLVDHNNDMLWTVSYEMNAPEVVKCGNTFAIYDSKGTSILICDEQGKIGEVSADKPIVKIKIAKQGVVAAILEDGQNTWIKCYTKEGSEIATLKTTFTNPGYPMDIGLSETGTLLTVDYLYIDNGTPVSRIAFYNFGTVGQNQKDNLVSETEYRDKIVPEVDYMDAKTCVAFREDGFTLFTGGQIPAEDVKVDVKQNIVSTFHDSEYIGLILQNKGSEKEYVISVYNKNGREILNKEIDFRFQSVELNSDQIIFSSKNEFCVYSLQGVEKFRGDLEVPASEFKGFGRNKYLYVTEDLFKIIQLKWF
ncbi:MAG: DUF5711 family protein [Lachnospiraceae bacterium]|nr:DUF5711 family protein [Lachnospiraceae bacterium]